MRGERQHGKDTQGRGKPSARRVGRKRGPRTLFMWGRGTLFCHYLARPTRVVENTRVLFVAPDKPEERDAEN